MLRNLIKETRDSEAWLSIYPDRQSFTIPVTEIRQVKIVMDSSATGFREHLFFAHAEVSSRSRNKFI
jgi:hypothetical protein